MTVFSGLFRTARKEGLGVTLHIAEVGAEQKKRFIISYLFLTFIWGMDDGADKRKKFDGG